MEIALSEQSGVTVVQATGRLNMVSAPRLKACVDDLVGSGPSRVVVDLAAVEFIDSSGLGAIVSALKSARQAGGDLRIAAATQQVLAVLQLTNLDRILRPHATVADAVAGW